MMEYFSSEKKLNTHIDLAFNAPALVALEKLLVSYFLKPSLTLRFGPMLFNRQLTIFSGVPGKYEGMAASFQVR